MNKQTLRTHIRALKRQHTEAELLRFSEELRHTILAHPKAKEVTTILAYHSLPDEVSTHHLLNDLTALGKTVILPKVISDTEMTLHPYTSPTSLAPGSFGILEPTTPAIPLTQIPHDTIALIPGMAFDKECHRLGRGKGYYDRLLQQLPYIYKIGVSFPFQKLETIPTTPYDVIMDEIL